MINDSGIDGTHADLHYPEHVIQNVQALTDTGTLTSAGGFGAGGTDTWGRSHRVRERAPILTTITKVPTIRH